jgi:hypothetical protein
MQRDSDWEAKAMAVMESVMTHPGALPFMIPPIVGDDFPEDYFKIVRCPIDFVTISARLTSHKYKTRDDWLRAVDLIFENSERYYQDGPIITLGEEIRSAFDKLYNKKFQMGSIAEWGREIVRLRDKLGRLNASTPQIPLCNVTLGRKLSPQIPTDKDIKALIAAMAKLTKPEDHEELLALLKKEEPEMTFGVGRVQVDLVLLKPSTIRLAAAFVKGKTEPA